MGFKARRKPQPILTREQKLEEALEEALDALRVYADKANWTEDDSCCSCSYFKQADVFVGYGDGFDIAEDVLIDIEKLIGETSR